MHALLLQTVGVFLGCVIGERRVEVVHRLHSGFGEYGTGPLCHVASHIEESVRVGVIYANLRRDEVAVLGVVASVGLEVGEEASIAALHALVLPRKLVAALSACSILPFCLSRQTITLYEACLRAKALEQVVGAPCAEGIGLLPCHAHDGIVVIGWIREVVAQVCLVLGVLEVVHPARRIRIYIYYICIEEVPRTGELTVDCLAYDASLVVDVSRVLRNHHHLVGIYRYVGVEIALLGIESVAAQSSSRIVIHLIAIVKLTIVEHLLAGDGVACIYAFDGTLLVLVGLAGQRLLPVEVRRDGVAVLVLCYHVCLVAAILRVSESCADDAVTHPHDELLVF